jgi:hypothetical protein
MSDVLTQIVSALYIVWLVIETSGIVANALAFTAFSRKRFHNTVFSTYYRFLCIADSLELATHIFYALQQELNANWDNQSLLICAIVRYTSFVASPMSSHVLALISIDRYVSISFPAKLLFRKRKKFQLSLLASIVTFNLIFYSETVIAKFTPDPSQFDNITNTTGSYCDYVVDPVLPFWQSVWNEIWVPFFLMIIFSLLTIKFLYDSRTRVSSSSSSKKRDRKFATVSISTNLAFLFLALPLSVLSLIANYSTELFNDPAFTVIIYVAYALYDLNFSMTFYTNLAFNSMFRGELLDFFRSS